MERQEIQILAVCEAAFVLWANLSTGRSTIFAEHSGSRVSRNDTVCVLSGFVNHWSTVLLSHLTPIESRSYVYSRSFPASRVLRIILQSFQWLPWSRRLHVTFATYCSVCLPTGTNDRGRGSAQARNPKFDGATFLRGGAGAVGA